MRRVLIGAGALAALIFGGYIIAGIMPHSANPVVAVAPPSPVPGPVVTPIPFPSPSPTAAPTEPTEPPTPTAAPTTVPTVASVPSPTAVPASPSPIVAPNSWTSLGFAGSTEIFRRCVGTTALYVAGASIAAVAGGC